MSRKISRNNDRNNFDIPDISVAIAVYNNEKSLEPLLRSIIDVLQNTDKSFELVLVDDGSTDSSREVISRLSETLEDTTIQSWAHKNNCGQHACIASAISLCRGDTIIVIDADLEQDPKDIPRFLEALGNRDLVLGVRQKQEEMSIRQIGRWLFRNTLPLYENFPRGLPLSTFSAMRRELANRYLARADKNAGYLIVLDSLRPVFTTITHPVNARHGGRSGYRFSDLLLLALSIFHFRWPGQMRLAGMFSHFVSISLCACLLLRIAKSIDNRELKPGEYPGIIAGLIASIFLDKLLEKSRRRLDRRLSKTPELISLSCHKANKA